MPFHLDMQNRTGKTQCKVFQSVMLLLCEGVSFQILPTLRVHTVALSKGACFDHFFCTSKALLVHCVWSKSLTEGLRKGFALELPHSLKLFKGEHAGEFGQLLLTLYISEDTNSPFAAVRLNFSTMSIYCIQSRSIGSHMSFHFCNPLTAILLTILRLLSMGGGTSTIAQYTKLE